MSDIDDDFLSYGSDSGNECDADSDIESIDDIYDDVIGEEPTTSRSDQKTEDDYPVEVLSTEQIVQDMVNSIKEVNHVIQVRLFISSKKYLDSSATINNQLNCIDIFSHTNASNLCYKNWGIDLTKYYDLNFF